MFKFNIIRFHLRCQEQGEGSSNQNLKVLPAMGILTNPGHPFKFDLNIVLNGV